jgi:hypothetical protein
MKSTRICPYCGSENVKQFGGCTQEECFFTCLDCKMLSDLWVDYSYGAGGKTYLKKKNCAANRERRGQTKEDLNDRENRLKI